MSDDRRTRAAELTRSGDHRAAAELLEQVAAESEYPDDELCSRLSVAWERRGDPERAAAWAVRTVDGGTAFTRWRAAAKVLDAVLPGGAPSERRRVSLAVLGTSTTTTLLPCLRLSLARAGVGATLHEAPYGQYFQSPLDPASELRTVDPDIVVLVPDHHALGLDVEVADPDAWAQSELERWTGPWTALRSWSSAEIVQVGFVEPAEDAFGNAAATVPGSRRRRVRALNGALADAATDAGVSFVDAEALAADLGKRRWFDQRFWHAAKHAFSMSVAPELGLRVAAVVVARLGLSAKAVILDLDNTLWDGVIGDDGLEGIELSGPRGEPHVALQQALRDLTRRGVVLAVCSKNDDATARLPFERHPDMILDLGDIAAFVANWDPKPQNVERIAASLSLGLDSFLYVDDNPAEREAIRRSLPSVDVLALSDDVAEWCSDLARYPWLEPAAVTAEDRRRAASYRARAAAHELEERVESLEDFQRGLQMTATIEAVGDLSFERAVQLVNKTNQFNLTTRRHGADAVQRIVDDPGWVTRTARLEDRFADHGLVAVVFASVVEDVLDVDTFVMSCRVIGRSLETVLIEELCTVAEERSLRAVRGHHIPTDRNGLVADLWERHGFAPVPTTEGASFELELVGRTPFSSPISVEGPSDL